MTGNWQIELLDEETATGDGGYITLTRLTHMATGVTLAAQVCEYEDDPRLVDEIVRDDMSLPAAVARRLVAKVFDNYAPTYRHHKSMGCDQITVYEVLANLIHDLYLPDEGPRVSGMLQNAFQALVA